jgi:hypothetical protein
MRPADNTGLAAALAVSVALVGAYGNDNDQPRPESKAPKPASAQALDADPYAIACGHVRDQQQWADVTRRATVALADREPIAGLNQLQATQSVSYAMTEPCKGRSTSYEPAEAAVRAVRSGRYRADLGAPSPGRRTTTNPRGEEL